MTALDRDYPNFKSAVLLSLIAHLALFFLIVFSPHFPKSSKKELIYYVPLVSLPGGGGGAEEKLAETEVPKRETLRDLTTPQKLQEERLSTIRHPVEKPKKDRKPKREKKAAIQRPPKNTQKSKTSTKKGTRSGAGSSLRVGLGGGPGSGSGLDSAYSSQIGLSSFPYVWYIQIIRNRVSGSWFKSLVDPGVSGNFRATVYFKILRNGDISDENIIESSGIESFDMSAIRALYEAAPFPPLPKEYKDEYLGVRLIFEDFR